MRESKREIESDRGRATVKILGESRVDERERDATESRNEIKNDRSRDDGKFGQRPRERVNGWKRQSRGTIKDGRGRNERKKENQSL